MFKNVKDWIKNFDRELWIIKNNVAELIKHQKKVPRTKNKKKINRWINRRLNKAKQRINEVEYRSEGTT